MRQRAEVFLLEGSKSGLCLMGVSLYHDSIHCRSSYRDSKTFYYRPVCHVYDRLCTSSILVV